VLSDMSVFHGIDRLDQVPADVFLSRMRRLNAYDGAVSLALREEATSTPAPAPRPAVDAPAVEVPAAQGRPGPPDVKPYTGEQLAAMAQSVEWGPNPGLNQLAPMIEYG
jgi:hypothetical protein